MKMWDSRPERNRRGCPPAQPQSPLTGHWPLVTGHWLWGLRSAPPQAIMPLVIVMSMASDAAQRFQIVSAQFAPARVLAALPRVSEALSRESAVAPAPQPFR